MPKAINRDHFAYVTSEAWRVMTAVEMGMKNHAVVPLELIHKIARVNRGGSGFLSIIKDQLVPAGLVSYEVDQRHNYRGYRLTNRGYDYLALHQLIKAGSLSDLGAMIGSGKESDVYLACAGEAVEGEDEFAVVKFHRLGRTSFRKVKEKREYHQNRTTCSWLYLDRLAAKREFEVMTVLHKHELPVPRPIANNRNAVVMEYLEDADTLCNVPTPMLKASKGALARHLYLQGCKILKNCVSLGLIHGDYNEFNLMVKDLPNFDEETEEIDLEAVADSKLVLIDFPQMLSRDNKTAQEIYSRDVQGLTEFFARFFSLDEYDGPQEDLTKISRSAFLDVEIKAPGYIKPNIRRRMAALAVSDSSSEEDEEDDEEILSDGAEELSSDQEEASSSSSESEAEDEQASSTIDAVQRPKKKPTGKESQQAINQLTVKERIRKERHIEKRKQFNTHYRKQVRVGNKQKFRDNIKAEFEIFGL